MSWREATLQDLVYFQRGFDITRDQQKPGDVPVISSSGITSFHNEAMADGPGVVIGRKGSLGTTHYCDGPYWPHDTTLWSKDLRGNCAKYVFYFLQTLRLQQFNVGNANPTLNRNHIHGLDIHIPPLDVQRRIADLLSDYDDLIENNRRRIQLLEESARLLYREWFVHLRFPGHEHVRVVDGVPEGWERQTYGDICEAIGGGTPSSAVSEYWDGEITWVTPSDITANDCLFLLDSSRKITEAGLKNSSAKVLPANAILMSSRASIGFFALVNRPVCTNQGFIAVVPKIDGSRYFLLFEMMCRVEEFRSRASGSTFKELSKGVFRELPVLWPQRALLADYAIIIGPIIDQIQALATMNGKLRQARDLLLPRLMSGAIPV